MIVMGWRRMGWFDQKPTHILNEDSPVGIRLAAVADQLERVTEQLERKLAQMRSERDREATD